MEVHAHTHTPRKKWTHYFWEFLMLFLAVFCGFLAEYRLEHLIEHNREKEFMTTMCEDLQTDTSYLKTSMQWNGYLIKGLDSLRQVIYKGQNKEIYLFSRRYLRTTGTGYTDRTSVQLKNSGGMRLIRNKKVNKAIISYWDGIEVSNMLEGRVFMFLDKAIDYRNKILNTLYYENPDSPGRELQLIDKPELLNNDIKLIMEYANLVHTFKRSIEALQYNYDFQIEKAAKLNKTIKEEYHLK